MCIKRNAEFVFVKKLVFSVYCRQCSYVAFAAVPATCWPWKVKPINFSFICLEYEQTSQCSLETSGYAALGEKTAVL